MLLYFQKYLEIIACGCEKFVPIKNFIVVTWKNTRTLLIRHIKLLILFRILYSEANQGMRDLILQWIRKLIPLSSLCCFS